MRRLTNLALTRLNLDNKKKIAIPIAIAIAHREYPIRTDVINLTK